MQHGASGEHFSSSNSFNELTSCTPSNPCGVMRCGDGFALLCLSQEPALQARHLRLLSARGAQHAVSTAPENTRGATAGSHLLWMALSPRPRMRSAHCVHVGGDRTSTCPARVGLGTPQAGARISSKARSAGRRGGDQHAEEGRRGRNVPHLAPGAR
jgi:hypothetical protein